MNKGFTLMELLGVIVIISLLFIIIAPNILEQINNKKGTVSKAEEESIKLAADLYLDDHPNEYVTGGTYCICLSKLQEEGKLPDSLANKITGDENYNGIGVVIKANGNRDLTLKSCSGC